MIILGVTLPIIGFVAKIPIIWTIGIIVVVVVSIRAVPGMAATRSAAKALLLAPGQGACPPADAGRHPVFSASPDYRTASLPQTLAA